MRFTLTIELGNDAMQTYADIAGAVRMIFADFGDRPEEATDDAGRIYDANGNKVGTWDVSDDEDDDGGRTAIGNTPNPPTR